MKKLSIKDIVDFRRKSERSKKTFVTNLRLDKQKANAEGGGDYWIRCLSAISNSYKSNDLQFIADKINELEVKYKETNHRTTKIMYQRNLDILYTYKNFIFEKWKPIQNINLLKKHKDDFTLTIKGLDIQATPHYVFTFQQGEETEVGAIWFIAKLNGFRKDELGMFADILYRYLKAHYTEKARINSKYCTAVDLFNTTSISYEELESGDIPKILNSTIDEINDLI